MKNTIYKTKLWKRMLSMILAVTIGFGTFVTMTVGNVLLSDYIGVHNLMVAEAAVELPFKYYRYNELVGLFKKDYTIQGNFQYKISENGDGRNIQDLFRFLLMKQHVFMQESATTELSDILTVRLKIMF